MSSTTEGKKQGVRGMGPPEFIASVTGGKAAAVYLLRGPDRFLHEECRSALVNSLPEEVRPWCLSEVEFEAGRLEHDLEAARQMPMLGGHSFVLFSDAGDFRHAAEGDTAALEAYLGDPSPFATLVFTAVEPDRRRKFIQLLETKATVVEMRPLSRREAAAWLRHYVRRAGIELDATLAEEIAARFETQPDPREGKPAGVNLIWMRTEIDKLLTARPGAKRLERRDLEGIVSVREEHEIGKLLQAIAQRNFARALQDLRSLLSAREPEVLLLWSIGDLFRQALKSGQAGGWSGYRAANPFSTFESARLALRSYSRAELGAALRLVRAADVALKSSWKDSRLVLETLVWQIVAGKGQENTPAFEVPTAPEAGGL